MKPGDRKIFSDWMNLAEGLPEGVLGTSRAKFIQNAKIKFINLLANLYLILLTA